MLENIYSLGSEVCNGMACISWDVDGERGGVKLWILSIRACSLATNSLSSSWN